VKPQRNYISLYDIFNRALDGSLKTLNCPHLSVPLTGTDVLRPAAELLLNFFDVYVGFRKDEEPVRRCLNNNIILRLKSAGSLADADPARSAG
jgi:hypothetical protein